MKIAFYIGTSFDLEDYKLGIIRNMPPYYDVTVVKRFNKPLGLANTKEEYIHSNPVFLSVPTKDDILAAERELGIPYLLLVKSWYNWDEKNEKNAALMREYYTAITQYFNYWKEFFSKNRIEVFVTTYESTFPEIISVEVAKKLEIPVIFVYGGRVSSALMLCDANCAPIYWKKLTESEKDDIHALLRERYIQRKTAENPQIEKDVSRYSDLSVPNIRYKFGRLLSYWNNYYAMPRIDRLRTISPFKLFYKYLVGQFRLFYFKRLFRRVDCSNTNYFLFPLQFIDETTQDVFTDQFDIICNISKCLPIGHYLIVKPHPHWKGRDIPLKKLDELAGLPNVIISFPNANTYELIQHSKAVFIINSTPGYEALALGKPVITFGHDALFANNNATITVRDMNNLPVIVRDAVNGRLKLNEPAVRELLARYYKHLIFLKGRFGMNKIDLAEGDGKKLADTIDECIAALKSGIRR